MHQCRIAEVSNQLERPGLARGSRAMSWRRTGAIGAREEALFDVALRCVHIIALSNANEIATAGLLVPEFIPSQFVVKRRLNLVLACVDWAFGHLLGDTNSKPVLSAP